jgi:hypothetical protein
METFREDVAYILSAINITSQPPANYSNDQEIITDHIDQAYYTYLFDYKYNIVYIYHFFFFFFLRGKWGWGGGMGVGVVCCL